MSIYIDYIDCLYGSKLLSLNDLYEQGEITYGDMNVYERFYGLKYVRRFVSESYFSVLEHLLKRLAFKKTISKQKIKYLLFSHTADQVAPLGDAILPALVKKFNLYNSIYFGSTYYNCVSIFKLLMLAEILTRSLIKDEYIILITADIAYTKILKTITGSTVMSDAGALILLSGSGTRNCYIGCEIHTYDKYADGIYAKNEDQIDFQKNYILYLSCVILDAIKKHGVDLSQIKYIFPHNVNKISWQRLADFININPSKVYTSNISNFAHGFGTDPFYNLGSAIKQGLLSSGDYYLLVSVGLGASFAAAIFQY